MKQQRISVAKSGVATSLKSRTTVLAAVNPAGATTTAGNRYGNRFYRKHPISTQHDRHSKIIYSGVREFEDELSAALSIRWDAFFEVT